MSRQINIFLEFSKINWRKNALYEQKKRVFYEINEVFTPFLGQKMYGAGNVFQPRIKGFFHILFY